MVTALVFTLPTGTAGPKDKLYPWEKKHKSPATTTDAVLCYGASHHRNPFLWDKGRFAPYVTYVDPDGKEQWLFDGFIFLESQDVDRPDSGAYSFMTGVLRDTGVSAGKEQWQELIDYYFTKGNCVDALEQAVKEATARLGKAPCKRRVIMMLPDPIIHRHYIDTTTTTTYWGELGGRRLDFNSNEDRVGLQVVHRPGTGAVRPRRLQIHRPGRVLLDPRDRRPAARHGVQLPSDPFGHPAPRDRGLPPPAQLHVQLDSVLRRPRP